MDTVRATMRRVSKRLLSKKSKWYFSVYPSPLPWNPVTSEKRISRSPTSWKITSCHAMLLCIMLPYPITLSHAPCLCSRCDWDTTPHLPLDLHISWPKMSGLSMPLPRVINCLVIGPVTSETGCSVTWFWSGWDNILSLLISPAIYMTENIIALFSLSCEWHLLCLSPWAGHWSLLRWGRTRCCIFQVKLRDYPTFFLLTSRWEQKLTYSNRRSRQGIEGKERCCCCPVRWPQEVRAWSAWH